MVLTRKRLLLAVLTLTMCGAGIMVAVWFHDWPVRRFAVVQEGVLYRSAQPDEAGWQRLRDRYGIRTVIDLRDDTPNEPWAVLERTFCAESGIRYINVPIGPNRLTDQELKTIIQTTTDPNCQPVLIHCELGKSRTGIAVAAYRVVVQGWSYETALAESQKFKKEMEPGYSAYLRELARGEGWRPAVVSSVGADAQKEYR